MAKKPTKEQVAQFFRAIEECDSGAVKEMLEAGMPPDVIGTSRKSALFAATLQHDYATILVLLDAGADPNLAGKRSQPVNDYGSPLNYACYKGMRSAAALLLDRGADPSIASPSDGHNAAHRMLMYGNGAPTELWKAHAEKMLAKMLGRGLSPNSVMKNDVSVLHTALIGALPLSVFSTLVEHGADPHLRRQHNGGQFIHMASNFGRADVLRMLVARGCDVNAVDDQGRTPLFYARDCESATALLAMGADLNHQDAKGNTALHDRVSRELNPGVASEQLVQLVTEGTRIDIKNNAGQTALDIAKKKKFHAQMTLMAASAARQAMSDTSSAVKAALHSRRAGHCT